MPIQVQLQSCVRHDAPMPTTLQTFPADSVQLDGTLPDASFAQVCRGSVMDQPAILKQSAAYASASRTARRGACTAYAHGKPIGGVQFSCTAAAVMTEGHHQLCIAVCRLPHTGASSMYKANVYPSCSRLAYWTNQHRIYRNNQLRNQREGPCGAQHWQPCTDCQGAVCVADTRPTA